MRKTCINMLIILLVPVCGMAQPHYRDSLRVALHKAPNDSVRYILNMQIGYYYQELDRDSSIRYYDDAVLVARKDKKKYAEAGALGIKGYQLALKGRYAESLQCLSGAFNIVDENKSESNSWFFSPGGLKPQNNRLYTLSRLQILYSVLMHATKNKGQEIFYLRESIKNARRINDPYRIAIAEINLGNQYRILDKLDSALIEENDGLKLLQNSTDKKYVSTALTYIGNTYLKKGNMPLAKNNLNAGMQWAVKSDNLDDLDLSYFSLTGYYLTKGDRDSSLIFAKKTLQILRLLPSGDRDFTIDNVYENLSRGYRLSNQPDSVVKYQKLALTTKDSIYQSRIKSLADFENLGFRQQLHLRDLEKEKLAYQSRVRVYAMLAGIGVFMLVALILYRNNMQKRKANHLLLQQKDEILAQKEVIEVQARESEIELALERVRARTMAMQKSEQLAETAAVLFRQFDDLGIKGERTFIALLNEDTRQIEFWGTKQDGSQMSSMFLANVDATFCFTQIYNGWKEKKKSYSIVLKGKDLDEHVHYVSDVLTMPIQQESSQEQRIINNASFSKGVLILVTYEIQLIETLNILERFAGVFDLTYTRFRDLQKAEEQARESQVEAALERVRAEAMAMHDSKDVGNATALVFSELDRLGINTIRCGVLIIEESTKLMDVWTATSAKEGKVGQVSGKVDMTIHPMLQNLFNTWQQKKSTFTYELSGNELSDYYRVISSGPGYQPPENDAAYAIPEDISQARQYCNCYLFAEGSLFAFRWEPFPPEDSRVLEKFAAVFSLTYRRYLDLIQAEGQAHEAIKQASVDRVRAEIASMRSTSDLERITPLVWNELTNLSVPFIRCGVFIIDEQAEQIHTYLSTPDGKAIAAFPLSLNAEGIARNVVLYWRKKQIYTDHWSEAEFKEWTKGLVQQGAIKSQEKYQTAHPPTSLDLHFFPFLQGMLYVGNITPLAEDEMDLVQSLADAFSTAYARYEDFNKLEIAKQQVDKTLTELKAAQTQLIQSEKMASLGELTAGIAHEIQNPLNFVNNFSEVNKELIDEMQQEIEKGDLKEIKAISLDIRENEQKINHHGKRADAIVKGMLQHSKSGSGVKEPTDINSLADEYMRLSYHGLRSRDKTFNAEMITHFDKNLPKINVIPQDIGRVFLNLFNNAFYAVNQKQKTSLDDYKPEVTVTTSTENNHVIIKVKDNGIGVPDSIKEKIMQPFFTTKPTGEGTGLGLSLTYDMVVKGHGGKIEVNSLPGQYTEFKVTLPLNPKP